MNDMATSEARRSRDRILEILLRSEEPLGIQALAAMLGISRNAAHQQMVALEEHITSFRVNPDAAAEGAIDLDKELAKDQPEQ